MGLKCQISFNKQGKATVMTKDGSPSVLYNDLLEITGNQEEALKYWASAYLDDFSNYTDKTEESASANDVAAYYDAKAVGDKKLSVQDKWSVSSFMKKNGIQSLSELQSKLHKIFKKDGVFFIDGNAAVKSGLYSSEEIENINPQQIINLLQQIEGQLLVEDILVVPETQKFSYKNNDYKTIFGTAERISEEKIDEEILAEINSIADVEAAIQNLPYTEFVEDFNNKPAFRAKVLKRFEGLKKIKHLSIFEGQLTEENINDEKLIENTILDNIPYTNIEAEAEYLESIDEDIWAIMPNQVTDVLKEIEDELIDQNIDLIGMNKFVGKKQEITDVLRAVVAMAKNPTTATIKTFAAAKRALFEERPVENKSFIKSTSTLSLFRVDTNLSQSELFDKHSLIKVGENLYHKVKKSENAALYDFLYKRIKDGTFSIPSTYTDVNDKVAVIKDLTTYVFSINENIRPDLAENFVLHKLAFDHKVEDSLAKAMDNFRRATSTRTNVDYLKTEFISDFYNYVLTEKQKDSEVYREVLQHFRISDNDISLTKNIASIANLDVTKELEDYIRIKRDSSMNYLISDESRFNEDLFYLNHPEFVKELSETYRQQGDYLLTDPTNNTWVKVGNDVYKNIYSAQGRDLFRKVNTKPDEVYYNTVDNFAFDLREVKEIIQTMLPAKSVYTKLKEKRDSIKEYFLPKLKPVSEATPSKGPVYNELVKVWNITKEQASTLADVYKVISGNIAKRLGITQEEYAKRVALKTVRKINTKSISKALKSFDIEGEYDLLNQAELAETYKVPQKYLKTVKGLLDSDFWLAKTLEYYEAKGDNLFTLGSVEKIKEEIGNRLGNKLDEIESNIDNYLIQYYTPTFIDSRLKLATDRNIVDDITHWTQIKEDSNYRDEVIQGKREEIKGAILYNTSYLKNSSDYSNEFKLLFLEDMMANRYSFDNEGNIKRQKVKPSDYKTTDSPVIQINSMALSSTYQNDKNKVLNYGDGNKTNFNVGANHLLALKNPDISIVSKEKYKKYFVKENNEGYWLKFPQGTDPEVAQALYEVASTSAKYPAKWCTGGSTSTASSQLNGGDFWMFVDKKTNDARIAVRYEGNNKIGELRGLGEGQSILPEDREIIADVVDTLPGGKAYESYQFVQEKLIGLRDGEIQWSDLSKEDATKIFMHKDKSYGGRDELLNNFKEEAPVKLVEAGIFEENEIFTEVPEDLSLLKEGTLFVGDLYLRRSVNIPEGWSPTISGSLDLEMVRDIPKGFSPTIGGSLDLEMVTNIQGGFSPTVGGSLDLSRVETIPDRFNPTVGDSLFLDSVKTIPDRFNPTVGKRLFLDSVETIPDGWSPIVGGSLILKSVKTIPDGFNPTVGNFLNLGSVTSIPDGWSPTVGGSLNLESVTSIPDGFNPTVGGYLNLSGVIELPIEFTADNVEGRVIYNDGMLMLKQDNRGAIVKTKNKELVLLSQKNADVTTPLHEWAHEYEKVLTKDETNTLEEWSGYKKGSTEFAEAFAKGAEKYIYEGSAGNEKVDGILEKLAAWFREIIEDAIAYFKDINELNPQVKDIYKKMLTNDVQKQVMGETGAANLDTPQVLEAVLSKLSESGLANNVYQMTPTELEAKLLELGVEADVAKQVIGKVGASNDVNLKASQQRAEKMLSEGIDPDTVEKETGWFKENGDWKFFSKELLDNIKIKDTSTKLEIDKTYNIEDLVDSPVLFKLYPVIKNIKIKLYEAGEEDNREIKGYYDDGVIYLSNITRLNNGYQRVDVKASGSSDNTSIIDGGTFWSDKILTLVHEIQHVIQDIEGFPTGGNLETILRETKSILGLDTTSPLGTVLNSIETTIDTGNKTKEEVSILKVAKKGLDIFFEDYKNGNLSTQKAKKFQYSMIFGEFEARLVESIKEKYQGQGITFKDVREEFAKSEDLKIEDLAIVRLAPIIQLQKALDKAGVSLTTAGFVHNNDVYLNIQNSNILNTALHEHGHLLLNLLEANRPDVLEAGFGLISKNKEEAKSYIDYVKETQPSLVEGTRAFNHEVLAQVIGDSGQRLIESKKKNSLSNWLQELWNSIKEILGISNYTAEQVSNMTLEEFGRSVNAEMLSGENVRDMISKVAGGNNLLAPNGKVSNLTEGQWKMVRTPEFKTWFGDWENDPSNSSKVVDENGEPKVMFTGTSKDKDFESFNIPKNGAWFTSDPAVASNYAEENDSQKDVYNVSTGSWESLNTAPRVIPVFIKAESIADFNSEITPERREKLRYASNYKKLQADAFQDIYYSKPLGEKRFDAIDYTGDGSVIVVLEDPTQIKSAIGNNGKFSPTNKKIAFQKYSGNQVQPAISKDSTKINKVSSILDFDINFMDQYDEKEVGDINQDINECG